MLYDHRSAIFWPRVPYAVSVRAYFKDVEADKAKLQLHVQEDIETKFARELIRLFKWFQSDL
jgi:hypothetical protein